ncbi:hypothetical protein Q2T40_03080 [Winogradskyella maritima]|nr:hypothetical protein [Winogradskyella maritima]
MAYEVERANPKEEAGIEIAEVTEVEEMTTVVLRKAQASPGKKA